VGNIMSRRVRELCHIIPELNALHTAGEISEGGKRKKGEREEVMEGEVMERVFQTTCRACCFCCQPTSFLPCCCCC